jgi:hypothetical protein
MPFQAGHAKPSPLSLTRDVQPDLIAVLSNAPGAAERLLDLRQDDANANALIPKHEQVREVTGAKIQAEARLSRLLAHPSQSGFGLPPTDARVIAAERAVEEATVRSSDCKKGRPTHQQNGTRHHGCYRQSKPGLRDGRPGGTVLEDLAGPPLALQKNEGLVDAIARDQQRIDQLKAHLDGIRRSGFPVDYCKREMRQHITALSERGRPDVLLLTRRDDDIAFTHERQQVSIYNADRPLVGFGSMPDVLGLVLLSQKLRLSQYAAGAR